MHHLQSPEEPPVIHVLLGWELVFQVNHTPGDGLLCSTFNEKSLCMFAHL
jgi:hypothetical protein